MNSYIWVENSVPAEYLYKNYTNVHKNNVHILRKYTNKATTLLRLHPHTHTHTHTRIGKTHEKKHSIIKLDHLYKKIHSFFQILPFYFNRVISLSYNASYLDNLILFLLHTTSPRFDDASHIVCVDRYINTIK